MIEIQGRHQFKSAAAKIQRERMSVRRMEAGAYFVRNTAKGLRRRRSTKPPPLRQVRLMKR